MDDRGTIAEAVSVDGLGRIVKVGTEKDVMAGLGTGVEVIRLEPQQVLMPGFIDPHMHFLPTLTQSLMGTHNLAPCLPPPYSKETPEDCATRAELLSALKSMKVTNSGNLASNEFVLGMNLDPSRQQQSTSATNPCGVSGNIPFAAQPKLYLDACVSKDRPVLILDQSGHLAYVNQKAIDAVCSKTSDNCKTLLAEVQKGGGDWVTDANGYTGLLQETAGFAPFLAAMEKSLPLGLAYTNPIQLVESYEKDIQRTIQELREAGLTTIADGGLASLSQLQAVKFLAERQNFPLRITGVVTQDLVNSDKGKDLQATGPTCDPLADPQCKLPKWLGAGGIKLWVDGSTQGCTAWLEAPYQYQNPGHCQEAGEGRADFDDVNGIVKALKPHWDKGAWRFQLHANGNKANEWAIQAFTQLQLQKANPHRVLFIHNTVGEEKISDKIGKMREGIFFGNDGKTASAQPLDARVTHLIGHVAYWGAAFKQMLGEETAKNIDPMGFDLKYGVPFSLHSDSMVTPPRPLWFVEQAVTRRTWAYPDFKESFVLGPEHAVSIEQALRAVTVEPARQHELDQWLGSIEPRKVADFVVLGANPLKYDKALGGDPTQISKIQVLQTYLNGKPTLGSH
ncbi:amidohydrolase [Archangium lansingense]|uniref:Amidohydrolase family protein n=1 Tax=Archangium lansingense TaxID=2995310 RepID=A0ABT4AE00_9BACT|nr:amidohydrolase family protein [Archangium lansinium]MCY1079906.1 amidohydrolase family protein [Archangium lansinium]